MRVVARGIGGLAAARALSPLLLLAALAGCSGYAPSGVKPGDPADDVIRLMGSPTGRHAKPDGGEVLEYSRGTYGKNAYLIDVDAQRRVVRWRQARDERVFDEVEAGMTRDEVLRILGRPSETQGVARPRHTVWSYRYFNPICNWFQVSIDGEGRVAQTGYGMDPICARVGARSSFGGSGWR